METLKLYVTATPGCSNPSYFGVGGFRAVKGGRELHKALFTFKGSKVTDFSVITGTVARALEWCSGQREREVEIYLPWAKALNLLSGRWIPKKSEALLVEVKLRERWFDKVSYLLGRDARLEQIWRPNPGEVLKGTVRDIRREIPTRFQRTNDLMVIETADGRLVGVWKRKTLEDYFNEENIGKKSQSSTRAGSRGEPRSTTGSSSSWPSR